MVGSLFPFDTTGVDFVMTALFIVIFSGSVERGKIPYPRCNWFDRFYDMFVGLWNRQLFDPRPFGDLDCFDCGAFFHRTRADGGKGDEPC